MTSGRVGRGKEWGQKRLNNLIQGGSGALGNAATRIEAFVASGGTYVYGSYPDIDRLFQEQAVEVDRGKRSAILQRIQELISKNAIVAPIQELAVLTGVGPRVDQPALGLVAGYPFSMPYGEVKLKAR